MKNVLFLGILATLPLFAQGQEGSVAIAESIRVKGDPTSKDFTDCVKTLVDTGVSAKDSVKSCKDVAKIVAKTTTRVANEAADATKASRPKVIFGGYGGYGYSGYGYSNYGFGGSYSNYYRHRPTVIVHSRPYHTPRLARPTSSGRKK